MFHAYGYKSGRNNQTDMNISFHSIKSTSKMDKLQQHEKRSLHFIKILLSIYAIPTNGEKKKQKLPVITKRIPEVNSRPNNLSKCAIMLFSKTNLQRNKKSTQQQKPGEMR